jgi:hypothetical protein
MGCGTSSTAAHDKNFGLSPEEVRDIPCKLLSSARQDNADVCTPVLLHQFHYDPAPHCRRMEGRKKASSGLSAKQGWSPGDLQQALLVSTAPCTSQLLYQEGKAVQIIADVYIHGILVQC